MGRHETLVHLSSYYGVFERFVSTRLRASPCDVSDFRRFRRIRIEYCYLERGVEENFTGS
jgi:hypothetical protein